MGCKKEAVFVVLFLRIIGLPLLIRFLFFLLVRLVLVGLILIGIILFVRIFLPDREACRIGPLDHIIGKAVLHGLVGIHPCLIFHELRKLGPGHTGLCLIGIDDGILHLVQHVDRLLQIPVISHGNRTRVVDHEHTSRTDENLISRHRNDGCSTRRKAVDLHSYMTFVVTEHVVDLSCRKAVTTG